MASDYTVIIAVRQRFGDNPSGRPDMPGTDWDEYPIEAEAPFVGLSKDFVFDCPHVDSAEFGILQFNALAVSNSDNELKVNGVNVPGGISGGPSWYAIDPHVPLWNTHSLLIERNVLKEYGNVLHIKSSRHEFADRDDFIIDNAVMMFKTRTGHQPPVPPQNQ